MRNHKLLTQMPGELEHAVKCRCNHNCTLDEISNTLQDVRKRTKIGKYTPYKSIGFKEKQPFRVELKEKPRERVAEVAMRKNSCHTCGSTDHYANNCPKAKKKVYAIEKVQDKESPKEESDSDSMGDAIREQSDEDKDPREEFLVEYQEETPLEIQDIQLEAGMPQDAANKNLCKHTQDAQTFLVTPTKGMAYIHGTATEVTVCIDNSQNSLSIDSGEHCSIVARNYLAIHFPKWENQLLPIKAKNFKSASGKITSIGTIIKEIIIPHMKGNIRLNPEFVVLDDSHIQGFLLGTDYQRMYGIGIYNSKNRPIIIGTNKEKKFSLDIYQISAQDPLEELLNEFSVGQFITTLTTEVLKNPVPRNIKEIQSFLGFSSYYRNHIKSFAHITSILYKLCSKDVVFGITKERRDSYDRIKYELTNAHVLILPDFELPFKLYIDAACSRGLGASLYQRQIVDGEPREGVIFYISRKLKDSEARYGATQTEFLCLVWALEKLHYYLEGAVFEVYIYCKALKSLLNMKTINRHILRWQIAIQEYRGNIPSYTNRIKVIQMQMASADGHWIMSKATQLMNLE
ncbi:hypothetical protein O181_029052 [Austropuccinia psidii MF-1]|uniref:CCHC-type domain-containing protein n=1 Tax=Austropuccinia psidii MF-1 TaxID=1389203 RepID=A0A9Q3CT41_9BASI|nr:hypothetical protein [Austropuccinia psidii MF-1]